MPRPGKASSRSRADAGRRRGWRRKRARRSPSAGRAYARATRRGARAVICKCNVVSLAMLFYIVGNVTQLSIPTSRLDRIAMGLSGLCLVHCVATAVLLALVSAAGGFLGSPVIHEVGLSLAMIIGAFALGRG